MLFRINVSHVYLNLRFYVQFMEELGNYEILLYDEFNRISESLYKVHTHIMFKDSEDAMYFYFKYSEFLEKVTVYNELLEKTEIDVGSIKFRRYSYS